MVHAAFLLSLGFVAWKQVQSGGSPTASIDAFRSLYLRGFFPLSFLFPAIFFLLCGLYQRSRPEAGHCKWRALAAGAGLASLVYLLCQSLFSDLLLSDSLLNDSLLNHAALNHAALNHAALNHAALNHAALNHSWLNHAWLNPGDSLPYAAALVFLFFVHIGVFGSRWLKRWVVDRELQSSTLALPLASADLRAANPEGSPVLVVGGAGYIGSVLCRRLLAAGHQVRVLDCLIFGDAAIQGLRGHPRFELQIGDCRSIQSVVAAAKGVDAIVHLAAIVGDPACEQDRQSALEINFAATRMLIEVAKGHGIGRFLFASSCSVYGAADQTVDEHSRVAPISHYARTKMESERALLEARSERFHPVILRLATLFGDSPRPRFDLLINLLAAKAYREHRIVIYNGEQWRPFIHVDDVAAGILRALRAPLESVSGEIFNVGDDRLNHTLREVAEQIRAAFPFAKIEWVENADRRDYRVSFQKIREQLGFRCCWTTEAGIAQMKRVLQNRAVLDHGSPIYHNQRRLEQLGSIRLEDLDSRVMAAFAAAQQEAVTVDC